MAGVMMRMIQATSWKKIGHAPAFSREAIKVVFPMGPSGGFVLDGQWIYWFHGDIDGWYKTHADWAEGKWRA